jgi:hypothetical protein
VRSPVWTVHGLCLGGCLVTKNCMQFCQHLQYLCASDSSPMSFDLADPRLISIELWIPLGRPRLPSAVTSQSPITFLVSQPTSSILWLTSKPHGGQGPSCTCLCMPNASTELHTSTLNSLIQGQLHLPYWALDVQFCI